MDPFNARFHDRQDGGRALARRLAHYAGRQDAIVVGLPRGGVVTAAEVAAQLNLPLDVIVLKNVTVPGRDDLVMGAVGPDGVRITHDEVVRDLVISASELAHAAERVIADQRHRERLLRGDRPRFDLSRRTVIFVDDGIASGTTMRSAIRTARRYGTGRVVVAAPVFATMALPMVQHEADEVVYVMTADPIAPVSAWYDVYEPVTDADVRFLIDRHAEAAAAKPDPGPKTLSER